MMISRRTLLLATPALLTGCAATAPTTPPTPPIAVAPPPEPPVDPELEARYAAFEDGGYVIPAVPYQLIEPRYLRQRVADPTGEIPGTLVVDTSNRFLYLVEDYGSAMRYGIGVGREGFSWEGDGIVHWRQVWPRWKPPAEMIARHPELEKYSVFNGGMEPGTMNPLGARALYIYRGGEDTLYRLHGSPEWNSIGKAVSSGCVRLINHDIVDLYERIPYHAPIKVYQNPTADNDVPISMAEQA